MSFHTFRSSPFFSGSSGQFSKPVRILAGTIAVVTPVLLHATDAVRTWDVQDNNGAATANNNFYNNLNWDGDVRPTFGGNSDAYLFTGTGAAVVLNITGGLTEYVAKNFEFTSGAYTFTGGQNLTLGDSTSSPLNTGFIRNNSTGTQTFNTTARIGFSLGGVDAGNGNVVFGTNTTIDIGNGSAAAGRNVTFGGNFNVTINGTLTGVGTANSEGGAIFKIGSGTLLLQADNSGWNGRIEAQEGVIRINKGLALGSAATPTNLIGGSSSARIDFAAGVVVPEKFILGGRTTSAAHLGNFGGNNTITGELQLAAGGSEYGFSSAAGSLTIAGPITFAGTGPRTINLSGASSGTITSTIGEAGSSTGIAKDGTGTWTLSGTNTLSGGIAVNEGRLNVSTASTATGAINVVDGATLGITIAAGASTLHAPSLSLGTSTGATLAIDLGVNSGTTPIISTDLLATTASVVNVRGNLSVGQYSLIDYAGSIGGAGFGGLTLGTLPARAAGQLVNDVAGTKVVLSITSFDYPKWMGSITSDWNFDESGSGGLPATANWKEVNSGTVTTYLQGPGGNDGVLFDDSAPATAGNVNLTTRLTPASVTVSNSSLNYTFSGFGQLSGTATLTKSGSGTLTLANFGVNDYSGTTQIGAGSTVQIGDGVTDGAGSIGTGRITNNGTLVLNRPDAYTLGTPIEGDGSVIKRTAGTTTVSGNNAFLGNVTVESGTLKLGNPNALGSVAGGTNVLSGATIDAGGQRTPVGEVITVTGAGFNNGGALVNTGTGNLGVGFRNVVLSGPATFGGATRFDIRDNPGGLNAQGHALSKVGANSIFLANIGETHIGNLLVAGGRIAFEGDTTFGDQPGSIVVESGAELGLEDSRVTHTKAILLRGGTINITSGTQNVLAGPITLEGSGTIRTAANTTTLISGLISGAGDLSKIVGGVLILASDNQYTGRTSLTQGTLRIGNDGTSGSLGSGEISLEPASGQTATLGLRRSDANLVVSNNITSTGPGTNVVNIGAANGIVPPTAMITLSGSNSFTGALNVNGGSLRITNSSALGLGPKTVTIASNGKPSLRLNATGAPIDLSADISLVTSNDDATHPAIVNEVGNNTIRGSIGLSNGNGGNTRVSASAGTLLTLTGAIAPAATATTNRTLILDGAGDGLITGVLSDLTSPSTRLLGLTKAGTGTWALEAASTYTGATAILAGTLKLGSAAQIAASPLVTISAGATLDVTALTAFRLGATQTLGGTGSLNGSVGLVSGSTLSPETDTTIGSLTLTGSLDLTQGGRVVTNLGATSAPSGTSDRILVGGDLTLANTASIDIVPAGSPLAGTYEIFSFQGTLNAGAGLPSINHKTRYQFALDTTAGQKLLLQVSGSAGDLTWAAASPGAVWNTKLATNWNPGSDTFYDLDSVRFDDTAAGREVVIDGTVIPSSVRVNTSESYQFIGTGTIAGAHGGFFKEGTGALTLANNNTYTGPTEVSAGTLIVTGSISGSSVTVKAGATIGGTGTINTNNQPFVLAEGAQLAPGSGPGTLTVNVGTSSLDLSASLAGSAGGSLKFELGPGNSIDRINLSAGSLNIGTGVLGFEDFSFSLLTDFGPGRYTLIQTNSPIVGFLNPDQTQLLGSIGSFTGAIGLNDDGTDIVLNVVPEPTSLSVLLSTSGVLLGFRRQSRRRAR